MKALIVTGTPGTGKTTYAKAYAAEHDFEYIDGKELIKAHGLEEEFIEADQTSIVDEQKFARICEKLIKSSEKQLVIDSHLSHFIKPEFVEICFVTMCDISILKKRLEERGYSEKKIRDNLDAEIFQTCKIDAQDFGHSVEIVKTD